MILRRYFALLLIPVLTGCAGFHTDLKQVFYLSVENTCPVEVGVTVNDRGFVRETRVAPGQTELVMPLLAESPVDEDSLPDVDATVTFDYVGERQKMSLREFTQAVRETGTVSGRNWIFRTCIED